MRQTLSRYKILYASKYSLPSRTSRFFLATAYCSTFLSDNSLLHHPKKTGEELNSMGLFIYPNFITEEEESSLMEEINPILKKRKYEGDHWDAVIKYYKETEKGRWNLNNLKIFERAKSLFPADTVWRPFIHVLDLDKDGFINPHVDSVKFSGSIVAGLSLLSDCVGHLTLADKKDDEEPISILLKRRSFYIMKDKVRYDYEHAILGNGPESKWKGQRIEKERRISLLLRDEKLTQ